MNTVTAGPIFMMRNSEMSNIKKLLQWIFAGAFSGLGTVCGAGMLP